MSTHTPSSFNSQPSLQESVSQSTSSSLSDERPIPTRVFKTYSSTLAALARPGTAFLRDSTPSSLRLTFVAWPFRKQRRHSVPGGGDWLLRHLQVAQVERSHQDWAETRLFGKRPASSQGTVSSTPPFFLLPLSYVDRHCRPLLRRRLTDKSILMNFEPNQRLRDWRASLPGREALTGCQSPARTCLPP